MRSKLLVAGNYFLVLSIGIAIGCSSQSSESAPAKPGMSATTDKTSSLSTSVAIAQAETHASDQGAKAVAVKNAEEAKKLAEQHVSLRKKSWGPAKNVSEQGESYWVSFDTPEQELRLLGPRVVIINRGTGAASVQVRR